MVGNNGIMKKFCITFLVLFIILLTAVIATTTTTQTAQQDYLRIHVRANSNSDADQSIKYLVKDDVVTFLTPYVAQCNTLEKAQATLGGLLGDIEKVCNQTLSAHGFSYTAHASIRNENFPTRVYNNITLEAGIYSALIIELGEGVGDNWWCVIYPPLCFTAGNGNVTYRSLIYDIISKFFNE
jgi:stage II sporulation protein R